MSVIEKVRGDGGKVKVKEVKGRKVVMWNEEEEE